MAKVVIGSVVSTFGVRGDLKVYSLTDFASLRFKKGSMLTLTDELRNRSFDVEVTFSRNNGKFIIVHFKDIDDMTTAEKFKGYSIFMEEENMHKLKRNQYYHHDLLKCNVFIKDKLIGKVCAVENNGAHDILRITTPNNETKLIPFVKSWLVSVDIEENKIEIIDMEGM